MKRAKMVFVVPLMGFFVCFLLSNSEGDTSSGGCGGLFGSGTNESYDDGGGGPPLNKWDMDSDYDGYSDYLEEQLGYNPNSADDYPPYDVSDDGIIDFSTVSDVPTLKDIEDDDPDLWEIISQVMGGIGTVMSAWNLIKDKTGISILPDKPGDSSEEAQAELGGEEPLAGGGAGSAADAAAGAVATAGGAGGETTELYGLFKNKFMGTATFTGAQATMSVGGTLKTGQYVASNGILTIKPDPYYGAIEMYSMTTKRECLQETKACLPVADETDQCQGLHTYAQSGTPGYITQLSLSGTNARTGVPASASYSRSATVICTYCPSHQPEDECSPSTGTSTPITVANQME